MEKLIDWLLPLLHILGLAVCWSLKATTIVIGLLLQLALFVLWLVLVGLLFGRLPRPMMRYL
jgi:hypothetical protein